AEPRPRRARDGVRRGDAFREEPGAVGLRRQAAALLLRGARPDPLRPRRRAPHRAQLARGHRPAPLLPDRPAPPQRLPQANLPARGGAREGLRQDDPPALLGRGGEAVRALAVLALVAGVAHAQAQAQAQARAPAPAPARPSIGFLHLEPLGLDAERALRLETL